MPLVCVTELEVRKCLGTAAHHDQLTPRNYCDSQYVPDGVFRAINRKIRHREDDVFRQ